MPGPWMRAKTAGRGAIRGTEVRAVAEPDKAQQDMTRYHELAKAALADCGQDAKGAGGRGGGGGSGGSIGWGGEEYESAGDKQARRFRKRLERSPHQVALALGARPTHAPRPTPWHTPAPAPHGYRGFVGAAGLPLRPRLSAPLYSPALS